MNNSKNKIFFRLFLFNILFIVICLYFTKQLPETNEILRTIKTPTIQRDTYEEPFEFDYRGATYLVDPLADYQQYGLVVSHNDITSWFDSYHTKDSVTFKDICVVWGSNVMSDVYKRVKFKSTSWTCHMIPKTYQDSEDFELSQIANNHLLTANERVQKVIEDVKVGDQVFLEGHLVNYADSKTPNFKRKSSLTRTDTGNGACEVIYVNNFKILKPANRIWHKGLFIAKLLLGILVICYIFYLVKR